MSLYLCRINTLGMCSYLKVIDKDYCQEEHFSFVAFFPTSSILSGWCIFVSLPHLKQISSSNSVIILIILFDLQLIYYQASKFIGNLHCTSGFEGFPTRTTTKQAIHREIYTTKILTVITAILTMESQTLSEVGESKHNSDTVDQLVCYTVCRDTGLNDHIRNLKISKCYIVSYHMIKYWCIASQNLLLGWCFIALSDFIVTESDIW